MSFQTYIPISIPKAYKGGSAAVSGVQNVDQDAVRGPIQISNQAAGSTAEIRVKNADSLNDEIRLSAYNILGVNFWTNPPISFDRMVALFGGITGLPMSIRSLGPLYVGTDSDVNYEITDVNSFMRMYKRFMSNMDADNASAANVTLGNYGNSADVTGVVTIDTFLTTNWIEGSRYDVFFTGALTIRHNNNGAGGAGAIMLAGSINALTIASCRFQFELRGDPADGNALKWWEMGRTYV